LDRKLFFRTNAIFWRKSAKIAKIVIMTLTPEIDINTAWKLTIKKFLLSIFSQSICKTCFNPELGPLQVLYNTIHKSDMRPVFNIALRGQTGPVKNTRRNENPLIATLSPRSTESSGQSSPLGSTSPTGAKSCYKNRPQEFNLPLGSPSLDT
jgi:hypothetical protein